jgi:hypothetical protein
MRRDNPLLRQLAGITVTPEKNAVQKELDRLGVKRGEILRNTGYAEADQMIAAKMGPLMEEWGSKFVQTTLYTSAKDPSVQRLILTDFFIPELRKAALEMAAQENPELFRKVKFNRLPKDLRIVLERLYGINAESTSAAQQPE